MLVLIRNHFKVFYKPFLLQDLRNFSFQFWKKGCPPFRIWLSIRFEFG